MKQLLILAAASALALSATAQTAPRPPAAPAAPAPAAAPAATNPLATTLQGAHADLADTLDKLAALQSEIQQEKIPLSRELRELEAQVSDKRAELTRMQRLRDNSSLSLSQLQQQVKARQENIDYLANLIGEYGRALEVRLRPSERQQIGDQLATFEHLRNDADMARDQKLIQTLFMIDLGIARSEDVVGGARMPGDGVLPTGEIVSGDFLLFGPITYFASGSNAGLAQASVQGPPPVEPLGPELDPLVASTVHAGSGLLPLDATLGDAAAIAATEESLGQHIKKGGIWMIPIIASGLCAMLVALYKFFQIFLRVPKPDFSKVHEVLVLLHDNDIEGARKKALEAPGVTAQMLADGVDHANESEELIEEIMMERILDVQPRLESMLPFIAVAAATAPLLGLLGTVTGMINTFTLITVFGTGDAKSLSGGISEALITTEYGLIVAIPCLIAHALLSRRVQTILAQLEHVAVSFVNGLSRPPVPTRK